MSELAIRETPTGLDLLRSLEQTGAVAEQSLNLPADLTWDEYESLGTFLGLLHRKSKWLLADWLAYGHHTYGDIYTQAVSLTGLARQTCMNYASYARQVPPERRNPKVSFSSHGLVAPLAPNDQKRWLDIAEREQIEATELRVRIQAERNGTPDILTPVVSVEEAARNVWHASTRAVGNTYLVPAEVMLALREALGE